MTLELKIAVFAGLIPGTITGLAMLAAWILRARRLSAEAHSSAVIPDSIKDHAGHGPTWVAPLVLAVGYLSADYATNGLPKLWPDGNSYRFTHAALLLGLVGVLEGLFTSNSLGRTVAFTLARVGVLAASFWMLVEGYHDAGTVSDTTFYGGLGLVAIGGAWVITLAERGAGAASARVVGPLVAVIGGASIGLCFAAGYGLVAQSSTIFVAWGVAISVVAWLVWLYGRRRDLPVRDRVVWLDRGAMTVFAGLVVLHTVGVRFHTYPGPHGPTGLPLLALAPAGLALLALGPRDERPQPWRAGAVRITLALLLIVSTLAAASVPILLDQPSDGPSKDTNDPYADYYPG